MDGHFIDFFWVLKTTMILIIITECWKLSKICANFSSVKENNYGLLLLCCNSIEPFLIFGKQHTLQYLIEVMTYIKEFSYT